MEKWAFLFGAYRNIQIGSRQAVDWYSDTASLVGNVSDRLLPTCPTHSTQQGGIVYIFLPDHSTRMTSSPAMKINANEPMEPR